MRHAARWSATLPMCRHGVWHAAVTSETYFFFFSDLRIRSILFILIIGIYQYSFTLQQPVSRKNCITIPHTTFWHINWAT